MWSTCCWRNRAQGRSRGGSPLTCRRLCSWTPACGQWRGDQLRMHRLGSSIGPRACKTRRGWLPYTPPPRGWARVGALPVPKRPWVAMPREIQLFPQSRHGLVLGLVSDIKLTDAGVCAHLLGNGLAPKLRNDQASIVQQRLASLKQKAPQNSLQPIAYIQRFSR